MSYRPYFKSGIDELESIFRMSQELASLTRRLGPTTELVIIGPPKETRRTPRRIFKPTQSLAANNFPPPGLVRQLELELRLADNTFYSPDFAVMLATGELEMHEVKGFWEDDARVKIKVAASLYPFSFIAARPKPKKEGGGWELEKF